MKNYKEHILIEFPFSPAKNNKCKQFNEINANYGSDFLKLGNFASFDFKFASFKLLYTYN